MTTPEYDHDLLNIGQYPAEARVALARRKADGWHVHTANLNYGEVALLWERDAPEDQSVGDVLDLENYTLTHGGVTYKLVPTEADPPVQVTEQETPAE